TEVPNTRETVSMGRVRWRESDQFAYYLASGNIRRVQQDGSNYNASYFSQPDVPVDFLLTDEAIVFISEPAGDDPSALYTVPFGESEATRVSDSLVAGGLAGSNDTRIQKGP